jgi:aconitase B
VDRFDSYALPVLALSTDILTPQRQATVKSRPLYGNGLVKYTRHVKRKRAIPISDQRAVPYAMAKRANGVGYARNAASSSAYEAVSFSAW